LHIDLGKWADLLVIAPLSANSLSKMATVRQNPHCEILRTSNIFSVSLYGRGFAIIL